jgi:hypothetical protein
LPVVRLVEDEHWPLEEQLQALYGETESLVSSANYMKNSDVERAFMDREAVTDDVEQQIRDQQELMEKQTNEFLAEHRELETTLRHNQEREQYEINCLCERFTVARRDLIDSFEHSCQQFKQDINEQRARMAREQQLFELEYQTRCQTASDELLMCDSSWTDSLAALRADYEAQIDVLAERQESMTAEQLKMKRKCYKIQRLSRPQEVERIKALQLLLQHKMSQLAKTMKDLSRAISLAADYPASNGLPPMPILV